MRRRNKGQNSRRIWRLFVVRTANHVWAINHNREVSRADCHRYVYTQRTAPANMQVDSYLEIRRIRAITTTEVEYARTSRRLDP
jgi:hypothetical protein